MNIKISGHHLDITPALRQYITNKLDQVIRHYDQVIDVNVLLSIDNHKEKGKRQNARITVHLKGKEIFIESFDENMYSAINMLIDKLHHQIIQHKTKLQEHQHPKIKHQELL
ncbi:ribosome hibernation-promoting factor, HPF/YfiA family [Candidatus Pandoraea novymonadis]|uniref:ribosome hibernation-promoting factor, HPF/YfiA family n=1 Tax=Candidatus Pandoraea novymonadis TaxID=1808959 RepID=UPI000D07E11C|nr:ribosome-associated translation inhibitor RaiA [Candidatus Pandoraea novymonadis]